jgi:hypothetical protein
MIMVGVSYKPFRDLVLSKVTRKWQTTSLIAQQVILPPDVIARERIAAAKHPKNWNCELSDIAAVSRIISRVLSVQIRQKRIEVRKKSGNTNEYRLSPKPPKGNADAKSDASQQPITDHAPNAKAPRKRRAKNQEPVEAKEAKEPTDHAEA